MSYILERNVGGANGSSDQEQDKVPDNWVLKKLGEILNIERGSVITKSACSPGQVPVVAGGKTPAYYHNLANRKGPTITISASGANAGYISYYEMPIFASDCSTISEGVNYDLRFVYFFLLSRQSELYAAQKGGAQPHVNPRDVQVLSFMQPSLLEQTAIANILSDQESLVAHYNDLIALHEKRFAYLSDELLSGRLRLNVDGKGESILVINQAWQERELHSSMSSIPSDWNISNFGESFTFTGGGTPCSTNASFWSGNIPWVGPTDMGEAGLYIKSGGRFLSQEGAAKLGSKKVAKNSIVLSTRAPVGYVKIASNDLYTNQGCHSLYSDNFDSVYMAQWLKAHKWVLDKNSAGSTFKELSSKNLKTIQFAYPPIEEQTLISNVLSDQEALIAEYKKLRDAEKKRFDWLSDALLSGTYRVKMEA